MKYRLGNTAVKVFLFLAVVFLGWFTAAGCIGIYVLAEEGVYTDGGISMQEDIYDTICRNDIQRAITFLLSNENADLSQMQEEFSKELSEQRCNSGICITDPKTGVSISNFTQESWLHETESSLAFRDGAQDTDYYRITAHLKPDYTSYDLLMRMAQRALNWRYLLPWVTLVLLAAALTGFGALMISAGQWNGYEGFHNTWFDRVPLDVMAFAVFLIGCFCVNRDLSLPVLLLLLAFVAYPMLLGLICSFVSRCKAGRLIATTCIGWCFRQLRRFVLWVVQSFRGLTGMWRMGLALLGVSCFRVLCLFLYEESRSPFFLLLLFFGDFLLALYLLRITHGFQKLEALGRKLAAGDYNSTAEPDTLPLPLQLHGADLNAIQDGVQVAVSREMKAERMKTELITNVSHDIKTPLTSLISYVDLLQKEELDNPRVTEYLAVLERQSKRLKKLTEDLVELSKASSGTITVNPQPTDVNVFLTQLEGEYAERLKDADLRLVTVPAPENPRILADPMLLYRVTENLMSNILKYALSGTRVYLNAEILAGRVLISFKNVSREALNISPDELQERFVRGDNARTSEGSGLGLSIARSLTILQCGSFDLSIDGDLFRVDLGFPYNDKL